MDRKRSRAAKAAAKTGRAERTYARQLRGVAQRAGEIIAGFTPGDLASFPSLQRLLESYAEELIPWARATAGQMLMDVDARDREAWRALGNAISVGMRREILSTPVGALLRRRLDEQVSLITSIPIEAGRRVHELTLKGLEDSTRAREIAAQIHASAEVAEPRATLIARTEVSRTASELTQSRAVHVGSVEYFWRDAGDNDVRPGHKAMAGKVCQWANPPSVDENGRMMHFHAGQIWNCRCYPEPILPD